jgi:hypothetical protein
MKSTRQIKDELCSVERETTRISDLLNDGTVKETDHYTYSNGVPSEADWTFSDALTSYVSKKLTLKWVLGAKY